MYVQISTGGCPGGQKFKETKKGNEPIYEGCSLEWMVLPFDIRMLMMKARLGWSNASFNDLLCLLGSLLPKGNKVPTNTYRAKKN